MSSPPREGRSGNSSYYGERNKRTRRDSHERRRSHSSSPQQNRNSYRNNDRERTNHCNVNMYFQRRDYYHPTFNQYGAASNNYVRDTNINLSPHHDYNRGRGYGDEYNIPRRDSTHYHNFDHDKNDHYNSQSDNYQQRYHQNDPRRTNQRHDYHNSRQNRSPPRTSTAQKGRSESQSQPSAYKDDDAEYKSRHNVTNNTVGYILNNDTRHCNNKQIPSGRNDIADEQTLVPPVQSQGTVSQNAAARSTAISNSSNQPKKKKRKRKMSERRKQIHRERARKYQEG